MLIYDCKNCVNSKSGSVFNENKKCARCTVDSHNINGKPSKFKERSKLSGGT